MSLLTLMGLAAGWEFLKIAGISNVVLSLAYAQFMSVGTDSCILIAATMATFAVWGMPFGASLRVADKDEKALMLGYSISGVLGGVSEPALYGCGFKYGRCLTCMAIGGAVGGLVAAVGHVTAYTIGMTNVSWSLVLPRAASRTCYGAVLRRCGICGVCGAELLL